MKYVIVGGVAGGASAAARLRRLNESAEIIIFEKDEFISFANCGLPYHISGTIKKRENLILHSPESFLNRFNIDVRVFNEVISIDSNNKLVKVKNLTTNEEYEESYDKLILSPGAYPFVPPFQGHDNENLMTLRNIRDMDRIIEFIKKKQIKSAVVIGGGYIGVEVAENLQESGLTVNLVEMLNQILPPMDPEMSNILTKKMEEKGITVHLESTVTGVTDTGVTLKNGNTIEGELVICAIGVRPNTSLSQSANLKLGETGGILVDEQMQTSDPDIYAVGDVVEIRNFVTGKPGLIPMAGPANRQGRIAADNIMGKKRSFKGGLGTGIIKVFELQAAMVGINEKNAKALGYNYEAIHLHPLNHAGYYPGACGISLKVIFDRDSKKILGAQGIGLSGIDKRIDVIATAIKAGLNIEELAELELSYAPPFGSAKDPVNLAGFIAQNILDGTVRSITWDKVSKLDNAILLDVRTENEIARGMIPKSIHIPVDSLRERISEIPKDKNIVIICRVGVRGHISYQILRQNGFSNLYNLSGGYLTYCNYSR